MHASREVQGAKAALHCIEPSCGARFGPDENIVVCPRCRGLLEVEFRRDSLPAGNELRSLWAARRASWAAQDLSGVWRFRELLPLSPDGPVVTLREGNSPLYEAPRAAHYCGLERLLVKHQGANPTGSFKDTGMTVAVTQAVRLGMRVLVCASTGNTAASLAAYAARAGVRAVILVPHGQVSGAKLAQSLDYGATVLEVEGNFDAAMRLVRELAEDASIYLVNSLNPLRVEGQKTAAAELLEQLGWRVPEHVVVPGGNLGNSSALGKGFNELRAWGVTDRLPRLSVVQAEGAAPFANLFAQPTRTGATLVPVEQPQTLASAIRIGAPVSWKKALRIVEETHGSVLSVTEEEIADAKAVLGRDGIGCEPASATTVAGIKRMVAAALIRRDEQVIAVLTGHLLKDVEYIASYHSGRLELPEKQGAAGGLPRRIAGKFANQPVRVPLSRTAILDYLEKTSAEPRAS